MIFFYFYCYDSRRRRNVKDDQIKNCDIEYSLENDGKAKNKAFIRLASNNDDSNKDSENFPLIVKIEDPVKFNTTLAGAFIHLTDDGDEKTTVSTTQRKHEDDIMPNSKMKKNIYSDRPCRINDSDSDE